MSVSQIPPQEQKIKPISLGEQLSAVKLLRGATFSRAFPNMRNSEVERVKLALDAAILTLSQLTDW